MVKKNCSILIGLFCLFYCLTGCNTLRPIPLSSQDRLKIHTINVEPQINLTEGMSYDAHGAQVGRAIGGIVGILMQTDIISTDVTIIKNIEKQNGIDLKKIVLADTISSLKKSGKFIVNKKGNFPVLKIDITSYGFIACKGGFSGSELTPVLAVWGQLSENNQILWRDQASYGDILHHVDCHTLKEFQENPKLLAKSWNQISSKVTDKLINKLVAE